MIRDRLICGLRSDSLRRRLLLQESDLTMKRSTVKLSNSEEISTNRQPSNMHLKAEAGLPDDGMFIHKVQDWQNTQCGAHAMRG